MSLAVQIRIRTDNVGDTDSILGWGAKIPQAMLHSQKIFKKKRNELFFLNANGKFLKSRSEAISSKTTTKNYYKQKANTLMKKLIGQKTRWNN